MPIASAAAIAGPSAVMLPTSAAARAGTMNSE